MLNRCRKVSFVARYDKAAYPALLHEVSCNIEAAFSSRFILSFVIVSYF